MLINNYSCMTESLTIYGCVTTSCILYRHRNHGNSLSVRNSNAESPLGKDSRSPFPPTGKGKGYRRRLRLGLGVSVSINYMFIINDNPTSKPTV